VSRLGASIAAFGAARGVQQAAPAIASLPAGERRLVCNLSGFGSANIFLVGSRGARAELLRTIKQKNRRRWRTGEAGK
jgi:hypothetical protein